MPATIRGEIVPVQQFVEGAAEEVGAAIVEYEFRRRLLLIEMWQAVGLIILEWHAVAVKETGQSQPLRPFVCNVLQRVGRSIETGYKAVQFAQAYPTEESLEKLPDGKATSWHQIVNEVLSGPPAKAKSNKAGRSKQNPPAILYDGPGNLALDADGEWIAVFPKGTQLRAWPGLAVRLVVKE